MNKVKWCDRAKHCTINQPNTTILHLPPSQQLYRKQHIHMGVVQTEPDPLISGLVSGFVRPDYTDLLPTFHQQSTDALPTLFDAPRCFTDALPTLY